MHVSRPSSDDASISEPPRRLFASYNRTRLGGAASSARLEDGGGHGSGSPPSGSQGDRLRSPHHTDGGRGGDIHIPVAHPPRSRQPHLHEPRRQGRAQTAKGALMGWARSLASLVRLRGRSANLPTTATQETLASQPGDVVAVSRVVEGSEGDDEQEMRRLSSTENATGRAAVKSRPRSGLFCPCFSPSVSDDGWEEEAPATEQARVEDAHGTEQVAIHKTVQYANFLVRDMDKVTAASYYWGVMDRFEAERLLDGKPEGTFLLRDSAQSEFLFSVSFRRYQRTLHARVEHANHKFGFDVLDSSVFCASRITDLIDNYKDPTRCLFFEPQLTHPLHRNFVFSLQQLCRASIASRTTYTEASRLALPPRLREFVKEYHYTHPVHTTLHAA